MLPGGLWPVVLTIGPFFLDVWLSATVSEAGLPGRLVALRNSADSLGDSIVPSTAGGGIGSSKTGGGR